ncbi:MAG: hypothetical protein JNN29_03600 [Chitinophagaceae bacterium]|nr:hypothetical protein [Chitinophagaceae bacterium]MBN8666164.1 hypothetical protein [Chitinophagales bacterium]
MKRKSMTIVLALFVVAITGCKKGEDLGEDCEDNNTTQVTYTNNGTVPLRVKVAATLTPALEPISPILDFDLAPGASTVKVFKAERYFTLWYNNCASSCALTTYYLKTFESCLEYEEKQ